MVAGLEEVNSVFADEVHEAVLLSETPRPSPADPRGTPDERPPPGPGGLQPPSPSSRLSTATDCRRPPPLSARRSWVSAGGAPSPGARRARPRRRGPHALVRGAGSERHRDLRSPGPADVRSSGRDQDRPARPQRLIDGAPAPRHLRDSPGASGLGRPDQRPAGWPSAAPASHHAEGSVNRFVSYTAFATHPPLALGPTHTRRTS